MAIYNLVLPRMGESVMEATITGWVKSIGDEIEEDESIVEVATDKVDSDVPSPVSGVLKEILFEEGDVVQVGQVIAVLEIEKEEEGDDTPEETTEEASASSKESENKNIEQEIAQNIPGIAQLSAKESERQEDIPTSDSGFRYYSPLVRSIAQREGLSQHELDKIHGSGAEGRLTKDDVLNYVKTRNSPSETPSSPEPSISSPISKNESTPSSPGAVASSQKTPVSVSGGDEIIEMDRMRRLIADHMVQSVHTSPHVVSFVEADVTNLVKWRNAVKNEFQSREGEKITFTPIFIEAISKALRDFPMINVSVDGYKIIKKKNINIGMAAALPSGNLIVPVIKNADQLSLVGLTKTVNDLAERARNNKLRPDDTQGGTFTFTNIGAFGNITGIPIINQPQAAILAVGTITKKPAVIETPDGDAIAIRHIMYLSMSYDHRVIDGALGGSFLKRVADYLEKWDVKREI